jgi:hypothetical protein
MTKWTCFRLVITLAVPLSFSACLTTTPFSKVGDSDADSAPKTDAKTEPQAKPVALPPPSNANWTLISENPFSYLPKELPKDSPTDHLNGEWVQSTDNNSRWFIPKGGTGERTDDQLRSEAFSMRAHADNTPLANQDSTLRSGLLRRFHKTTKAGVEE